MKLVVKIGGAALEDKALLKKCAQAVADLAAEGHKVAVVHGGGKALTQTLARMGKESTFVNGLRVTDSDTRDVALMVLAGRVNKQLVAAITATGQAAVGLCGGDGAAFLARKKKTKGADLGFVGEISSVDSRWIEAIWDNDGIPGDLEPRARLRWRVLQRERRPDGFGMRHRLPGQRADLSDRC